MCRILAFASPTNTTFSSVLGERTCTRFQMLARVHGDGWGAMWLANGIGSTSLRRFRAGHDGRYDDGLSHALAVPAARVGVAHLRMATGGLSVRVTNSHPFVDRGVGLAHNGTITPLAQLRELVAPASLERLRGTTDSELYLTLITDRMRAGTPFLGAVRATVGLLRDRFPTASLNAVLLSHTHMVVVHSSTHAIVPTEHFHGRLLPGEELPPQHDAGYYLIRRMRLPDGALAYASSGFTQAGWDVLPLDTLSIIELATMTEAIEPIPSAPPVVGEPSVVEEPPVVDEPRVLPAPVTVLAQRPRSYAVARAPQVTAR